MLFYRYPPHTRIYKELRRTEAERDRRQLERVTPRAAAQADKPRRGYTRPQPFHGGRPAPKPRTAAAIITDDETTTAAAAAA